MKASSYWIFCRFSPTSSAAYLPLRSVRAFPGLPGTMPSADYCAALGKPRGFPSPDSGTLRRPPGVSSTAFAARPLDLQPAPLMDTDFAVLCPLVRRGMPRIQFLSVGPRLCSTLPSDGTLRCRPCASLDLHLHQVGQRTFTPKLSNMPGTQRKGHPSGRPLP